MNTGIVYLARGILALTLMCLSVPAYSEQMDYAVAINKAGRQRMLTQRIGRLYCQIGLQVSTEEARKELNAAVNRFSEQLSELKQFNRDKEISGLIEKIEADWSKFRDMAMDEPGVENVPNLMERGDVLLTASEKLVVLLVEKSGNDIVRLVNVSGRQRMLSQRLAKFYLMQAWGLHSSSIKTEIERAQNEFAGALQVIVEADENSFIIKEKLEQAKLQWSWFNSSLNFSNDEYFPLIVVDASDKLLEIMETVTSLYQQVAIDET